MMEKLARNILALEDDHMLSKVRFAKTIYFVHKELIRNRILSKESIEYIRMPLGPVPKGFMSITMSCPDIYSSQQKNGLAYETQLFHSDTAFDGTAEERKIIDGTLSKLRAYSTSDLVETSHKDPSWLNHKNSDNYFITDEDMSNDLSVLDTCQQNNNDNDEDDRLQASLIRGMINDIVAESTKLEYPAQ